MARPWFFETLRAPWKPPTRGGVTTSSNGQVIEDAVIEATGTGITVNHNNVTIRRCKILYNGTNAGEAYGIYASGRTGLTIEDCEIINAGAPQRGALARTTNTCVRVINGSDLTVSRTTVRRGSTGLHLSGLTNSAIDHLESHDMRGPFPRGMALQWASCFGTHIALDLSDETLPGTSNTEDSFSVFKTPNVSIQRVKIPIGTDGTAGRAMVIEGEASVDCSVDDVEFEWMYNGAFYVGMSLNETVLPDRVTAANIKTRGWNRYSVHGWAGSSGKTPTGYPPLTYAVVAETPASTSISGKYWARGYSDTDTWNLKTIASGATQNIVEENWTPTLSVVRNVFPWRDMKSVPRLDLVPRIGSYWLDGVVGSAVEEDSVLAILPGRYINDPTSRAWQWYRDGSPISGATGLNYIVTSSDLGHSIHAVETPSNANGSGEAAATEPVAIAA